MRRLFDFLLEDVAVEAPAAPTKAPPAKPSPTRHKAPIFKVVLDTKESGSTASWGQDGLDVRGIQQRFAPNATTGGTLLEGITFVGSFTATVTAQTPELLSLRFTQTDNGLRKRLAAGPGKSGPAKKR